MEYLTFKNGDKMPAIGLGTWKAKPEVVKDAVLTALNVGYRHIDCAAIYANEKSIGEVLEQKINKSVDRDDLWITSKLWNDSHKAEQVIPALKKTLNDLKLEYLDLYLIHWPVAFKKGVDVPAEPGDFHPPEEVPIMETWQAMEEAVNEGLVKHIGVSNFNVDQLSLLNEVAIIKPEMNQIELHPYLPQNKMKAVCRELGIHLTAYSPLGSRDRSEKLKQKDEPDLFEDKTIKSLAEKYNVHPALILIAWAVKRGTAVIPKSTDEEHMKMNLKAVEIPLSSEEVHELENLPEEYRFVTGKFWEMEGAPFVADELF